MILQVDIQSYLLEVPPGGSYRSYRISGGVTLDVYRVTFFKNNFWGRNPEASGVLTKRSNLHTGSTISTLLHDKINPKNFQVLSLGDTGFLQFFRVVSRDYGKPRHNINELYPCCSRKPFLKSTLSSGEGVTPLGCKKKKISTKKHGKYSYDLRAAQTLVHGGKKFRLVLICSFINFDYPLLQCLSAGSEL